MGTNLITLLVLVLATSCNLKDDKQKESVAKSVEILSISNDWIKDKDGCLKLRNEKLAYKLIAENNLKNSNKADFLKVFGIANKIDSVKNQEVLIYYFDCVCQNGELYENGDKCYANFYFENGRLKTEEFICE